MTAEPEIAMTSVRLGARDATRRFGSVVANDAVSFAVAPGTVHAFVGANGAGKSTLMRMLQGLDRPDEGSIICNDQPVRFAGPAEAFAAGIGMVHQEFMVVPGLTMLENLILADEPVSHLGIIDRQAARAAAVRVASEAGVEIDWDMRVEDAPIHKLQILEIIRLIYRGSDVLILDEPTAVLAPTQVRELIVLMKRLRDDGRTILFITHKLHEVLEAADTITVLRSGRVVATLPRAEATAPRLAELMMGFVPVNAAVPTPAQTRAEAVLSVENLAVRNRRGVTCVKGASFDLARGEILGLAGIAGNGQDELVASLIGLLPTEAGHVRLGDDLLDGLSVAERRSRGVAYLSPDRAAEGLCLTGEIAENIYAGHHRLPRFGRCGLLDRGALKRHARSLLDAFDVKRNADSDAMRTLSGGNQQRVAMARELDGAPRVLIASQPTRGVDLRGIAFIHTRLHEYASTGGAVLLVSEELEELLALSDRIVVIHRGRISGVLPRADASVERVGGLMLGVDV